MRSIALCAALLCLPVHAAGVFDNGDLRVTFHDSTCRIPELLESAPEAKHATVEMSGRNWKACYLVDADGDYLLVDEHGRRGFLPGAAVKAAGA